MIKKILYLITIAIMATFLTACGNNNNIKESSSANNINSNIKRTILTDSNVNNYLTFSIEIVEKKNSVAEHYLIHCKSKNSLYQFQDVNVNAAIYCHTKLEGYKDARITEYATIKVDENGNGEVWPELTYDGRVVDNGGYFQTYVVVSSVSGQVFD